LKNPDLHTIHNGFFVMDNLAGLKDLSRQRGIVFQATEYIIHTANVKVQYGIHPVERFKIILCKLQVDNTQLFTITKNDYHYYVGPLIEYLRRDAIEVYTKKRRVEIIEKSIRFIKKIPTVPLYADEPCNICFEPQPQEKQVITYCCRRHFCDDCLTQTLLVKNNCPLCGPKTFI